MINRIDDCCTLSNGVKMPYFGLGTWRAKDEDELVAAIHCAVDNGYRMIDTAFVYGNEEAVGKAVATSSVKREDLFITSKLFSRDMGYDNCLNGFEATMKNLNMDYLDLYLIHWPRPSLDLYVETWKAMIRLYEEGRVRAIGVCNFHPEYLQRCADETGFMPMLNQVECHPLLQQKALKQFCRENNIQMEAYSPLISGQLFNEKKEAGEALASVAAKHGKSVAQVCIRWQLDNNVVVIPKSVHANRIIENANVFDFSLDAEDIAIMDKLDCGFRTLRDPAEG